MDGDTWMEPVKKAELLRDMQKDNEKIIIHAGSEIANLIVGYHRKRMWGELKWIMNEGETAQLLPPPL